MRVILIAIGMCTKPCIASLALIARNWVLLCNTDIILQQKKAFSAQTLWCNKMNFHKCAIMSGFCKSGHISQEDYLVHTKLVSPQTGSEGLLLSC